MILSVYSRYEKITSHICVVVQYIMIKRNFYMYVKSIDEQLDNKLNII